MSNYQNLIIGLGTGRCGTASLCRLLQLQNNSNFTHEFGVSALVNWKYNKIDFDKIRQHLRLRKEQFIGDVAFYNLPYWKYILDLKEEYDTKFIVLKRNKQDVIKSYMRTTIANNPFLEHDGEKWKFYEWDKCYPKMNTSDKEAAISMYYDHYYDLCRKIPSDKCYWFNTDMLDNQEQCIKLIEWCGFNEPKFSRFHLNTKRTRTDQKNI